MMLSGPPPSGVEVRPTRVLFVDDERLVLRSLERLVRAHYPGWELRSASCPVRALQDLGEFAADVLITDLSMPKMNGIELLLIVRERYPEIARMVYSAHVECLERTGHGDLAHVALLKPAHTESIIATLGRVVRFSGNRPSTSGAASA